MEARRAGTYLSDLLAVEEPTSFRLPRAESEARPRPRLPDNWTRLRRFRVKAANTKPAGLLARTGHRGARLGAPHLEAAPAPVALRGLPTALPGPFSGADLKILISTANV